MERHCNGDHMSAAWEQSSHSTLTLYLTHTAQHKSILKTERDNERKCRLMRILHVVGVQLYETAAVNWLLLLKMLFGKQEIWQQRSWRKSTVLEQSPLELNPEVKWCEWECTGAFLWSWVCCGAALLPCQEKYVCWGKSGSNNESTYCIFQVDGTFEFTQQLDGLYVPTGSWG